MREGVVIKPPMERVKSGKVFRPSPTLRNKYYLTGLITAVIFWAIIVGGWLGIGYMILAGDGLTNAQIFAIFGEWWLSVNIGYWGLSCIWIIPGLIITPMYINRIEYSVISESGEAMPEIYVRKGIVNITEKHVMFRNITSIQSRAGPLDRLFGIGNVEIQTAGITSGTQPGSKPEEKIEGIPFFEEVRDFVLQELRKFHRPYVTGTEVDAPGIQTGKSVVSTQEVVEILGEIRDLLRDKR